MGRLTLLHYFAVCFLLHVVCKVQCVLLFGVSFNFCFSTNGFIGWSVSCGMSDVSMALEIVLALSTRLLFLIFLNVLASVLTGYHHV